MEVKISSYSTTFLCQVLLTMHNCLVLTSDCPFACIQPIRTHGNLSCPPRGFV